MPSKSSSNKQKKSKRNAPSRNAAKKPLGKVVGGVYIVNAKKTVDPGASRRRRQRRDQRRTWSPVGTYDRYIKNTAQLIAPTASYPPGDPRRKSVFLGHVVDGALGWAADCLHHIPVVGPLTGHAGRFICRGVRWVEDGANKVTGLGGFYLFLISLVLLLPTPTGAVELSNCCTSSQVHYCTNATCVHDMGCVICQDGNETTPATCWVPLGPLVSVHPEWRGVDFFLAKHLDFCTACMTICELAGIQEYCGVSTVVIASAMKVFPKAIILNETADCYLLMPGMLDPGLWGFLGWLAHDFEGVTLVIEFLLKLPGALVHLLEHGHYVTLAAIAVAALNGKLVRAMALTVIYVEAVQAEGNWNYSATVNCSPWVEPPMCPAMFKSYSQYNATMIYCGNPLTGVGTDVVRSTGTSLDNLVINGVNILQNFNQEHRKTWGGWWCVIHHKNDTKTCCTMRVIPKECSGCYSDCAWLGKNHTYDKCGATPWLTTACASWNKTQCLDPMPVAWLSFFHVKEFAHMPIGLTSLREGIQLRFRYNKTYLDKLRPQNWARLPGIPPTYRGSWMNVPKGMYSDFRDLSTGLITKDSTNQDYQFFYSATGALRIPNATYHLIVICVLAAMGANWTLMLYAIWLTLPIPGASATPTSWVAATAASWHEDWYARALLYILICKYRKLAPFFSANLFCLIVLVYQVGWCDGYSPVDCALACASVLSIGIWTGYVAQALPFLCLTHSYLKTRFDCWMSEHDNRALLCLAVVLAPQAVQLACVMYWACYLSFICLGGLAVELFAPRTKLGLVSTLNAVSQSYKFCKHYLIHFIVWCSGERGIFLYEHLDGEIPESDTFEYKDPYYPIRTQVLEVEDAGRKLACGDSIKGHPVFCRAGSTVRAGIGQLARGWQKTAPFSCKTTFHRNDLRGLGITVTGYDNKDIDATICVMSTAMKSWMGFGYQGYLQTCLHGSKARNLATKEGPRPPTYVNKDTDSVRYPLPQGFKCLEPCSCNLEDKFLVTRFGKLIPVLKSGDKWVNTAPLTLREAKGSSGAPVLCKCGNVSGMFVACRSVRGAVSSLRVQDLDALGKPQAAKPEEWNEQYPQVPKRDKEIKQLVAPTGSGKTTKLPLHYYSSGYRVLVLNPSVATTTSMGPYIKSIANFSPNIVTGDNVVEVGSRLTYMTYGMFLARGCRLECDVVICDECHATDATTVLGIGGALSAFEDSRAKLLILATATPPGTPMQPHSNITTHDLTDEGEIPFHGKKLKLDSLRKGRHLIFQATKKHCEELAATLAQHGIKSVYYYRGRPISVIPKEGDVVVVATDALMTGYTGNFDSVYDCCLSVSQELIVTMAPTFEVAVRTKPADVVTRMQRRGRTGRGRPGEYYQVTPACSTSGTVNAAVVYECFDSGLAWYGLTAAEVATYLDWYSQQAITPVLEAKIGEVQQIFLQLGYVSHSAIQIMKNRAENYVYLHAAQYQAAREARAMAPSDDEVWKGLDGSQPFPLMYVLTKYDPDKVKVSPEAPKIAACYEEWSASATVTIAGVGMVVASAYMAVEMFGHVYIKTGWTLTEDTTAATCTPVSSASWEGEVEECVDFSPISEMAVQISASIGDWLTKAGIALGGKAPLLDTAKLFLPHFLAAIQYFCGLVVCREAPVIGSVMGFVGGMLSPLPLKLNLFLGCLGAGFCSRLSSQRGAAVFGIAGALGAVVGATTLSQWVGNIFATYSASTATCLVVLKLLDGQMPDMHEWSTLIFNVASPGGCVIGAATAAVIAFLTRSESNAWMNRLLAMLNRGSTCEDYYLSTETLRAKIIKILEVMNIYEIFNILARWIHEPEEDLCSFRGMFEEVFNAAGRLLRYIVEFGKGVVNRLMNLPGLPMLGCQTAYKGPWLGSGVITATCSCGEVSMWNVEHGKATHLQSSRKCRVGWRGGVPINNMLVGTPRPAPCSWNEMVVNTGFSNFAVYKKVRQKDGSDKIFITKVSSPDMLLEPFVPEVISAVAIDGVQTKPYGGTGWNEVAGQRVRIKTHKGIEFHDCPVDLDLFRTDKVMNLKTYPVTCPPSITRPVELTSRAVGMERHVEDSDDDSMEEYRRKKERSKQRLRDLSPSTRQPKVDVDSWETVQSWRTKQSSENWAKEVSEQSREEKWVGEFATPSVISQIRQIQKKVDKLPPTDNVEPQKAKPSAMAELLKDDSMLDSTIKEKQPPPSKAPEVKEEPVVRPKEKREPPEVKFGPPGQEAPNLTKRIRAACDKLSAVAAKLPDKKEKSLEMEPLIKVGEPQTTKETSFVNPCYETSSTHSSMPSLEDTPRKKKSKTPKLLTTSQPPQIVKSAKGSIAEEAIPLVKKTPSEPETYSLADSSWSTVSTEDECSWSYIWATKDLAYRAAARTFSAVRTLTDGLMSVRSLAYATDTSDITARAKKVTIHRSGIITTELAHEIDLALKKLEPVVCREWSVQEALDHTSNKTAKSGVTGATAKILKAGCVGEVNWLYDKVTEGTIPAPYNQVNIMPKSEVFVKTKEKPTKKPARIIAYPHLEMRVVEKMILGEIGPTAVKTICGKAYGFQYTPIQRVGRMLEMWREKSIPAGFTCDTVCFDSTITPSDMDTECRMYQACTNDPTTKARIRTLHDHLYKGGPMVMQGRYVGERQCRASGVYTTSSSNTITCYLKVNAAAKRAGIKSPSWLINGDDCVCIFESQGPERDKECCQAFAEAMQIMGAPQGEVPKPLYSLELLDSCSSNASVAQVKNGMYHYLTRDPRIPLARASVEGRGFNPLGTWLGYILANYPAVWVSRIICVQFLANLLTQDDVKEITFEWYGNNYTIPLNKIPYIIQSLHGRECWNILQYTPREIQRVGEALQDITMKPLRHWKRLGRQILASARRRRGTIKFLANTLLSWVHHDPVRLDEAKVKAVKGFNPFDPTTSEEFFEPKSYNHSLLLCAGIALAVCLLIVPLYVG
nr:polyprotein [Ringtail hepacivirus]